MATIPNADLTFAPREVLTADKMNKLVANDKSLLDSVNKNATAIDKNKKKLDSTGSWRDIGGIGNSEPRMHFFANDAVGLVQPEYFVAVNAASATFSHSMFTLSREIYVPAVGITTDGKIMGYGFARITSSAITFSFNTPVTFVSITSAFRATPTATS